MITIEVAYGTPEKQLILELCVEESCTMLEAVQRSGIVDEFPEIDPESSKMGIFGKAVKSPQTQTLREGDRIEIYRPLLIDPKQARLNRAAKKKKQN